MLNIIPFKEEIKNIYVELQLKRLDLFGSATTDDFGPDSDLDITGEALHRIRKLDETYLLQIIDANKIIGFRNVIIHGYDVLDSRIVGDAAKLNLPKLKENLRNLL